MLDEMAEISEEVKDQFEGDQQYKMAEIAEEVKGQFEDDKLDEMADKQFKSA